MRVVLTGASSFTGFWFARLMVESGVEVVAPLSGSRESYRDTRGLRTALLARSCELRFDLPFGSPAFLTFLHDQPQIDAFCHHWSMVRDYRSPDFDAIAALQDNARALPSVLDALAARSCRAVVLTGSVGEPREGGGPDPDRAFSPYALSKGLTADVFEFYCRRVGMPLDKFVIPNPFGPYEERRFTHYLMCTWRQGGSARVATPDYVRDNIHVDLLARVYADFVLGRADDGLPARRHLSPSLYVEPQGVFAERVAREVRVRTRLACELTFARQSDFREPMERANSNSARALSPDWDEAAAWIAFVDFYEKLGVAS